MAEVSPTWPRFFGVDPTVIPQRIKFESTERRSRGPATLAGALRSREVIEGGGQLMTIKAASYALRRVSVVIPALNEALNLPHVFARITGYPRSHPS